MVRLEHLTKSFGKKVVLNDISLTIGKGEIFGLIGKNGAGKTTLLSIIAGLSDATNGTCIINGRCISKKERFGNIGYLPDVPAFFDYMSVNEFLDFLYKKECGYRVKKETLLQLVGLRGETVIKTMSRGMRQRLGMASTLVNNPDVILLDEPSSALDPLGRHELSQILLQLKQQGKTIILSTHILTDMESICDRVGFLHTGTIVKTLCPNSTNTSQKISLSFMNPINKDSFLDLPLNITFEDDHSIIISGNFQDIQKQKALIKRLYETNNTVTYINTMGADLDTIFREVCQ